MADALNEAPVASAPVHGRRPASWKPTQTVLVLQGGGALGAYQAGVYEAMHEAGIEPDWVIGTSIGAINASLIAGNRAGKSDRCLARVLASYDAQVAGAHADAVAAVGPDAGLLANRLLGHSRVF